MHVGLVYFQDNWETISKNDQFEAIPFKTGIAHGHVFPVSFQVYFLYILQPPGYKINHTYYFALFHLFLVHVWVCFFLLKVVTSYSHVTEDEAYVFRLQKLCREDKVHNSYICILKLNVFPFFLVKPCFFSFNPWVGEMKKSC